MRNDRLRVVWSIAIALTAAILCLAPIAYMIFVAKDPETAPSANSPADQPRTKADAAKSR